MAPTLTHDQERCWSLTHTRRIRIMGLKAREESSTHRSRCANLKRPLQGRLWGWGVAVARRVLCCSLEFAAGGHTGDAALPAWMTGALQQAAEFPATRAEQSMLQQTPP